MEVRAVHKNARISPRKVRPLARILKGLEVTDARAQLTFLSGKAADLVRKVLASAVANAKDIFEVSEERLRIADVVVNEGFRLKRHRPVSRGMAHPILKRTAHIEVVLEETAGTRLAGKRKDQKTEITTVSADELAAARAQEDHHDHAEHEHGKPDDHGKVEETEPRSVEERKGKGEYTAFQKTKMMQQGGDKKKSFRRKSV